MFNKTIGLGIVFAGVLVCVLGQDVAHGQMLNGTGDAAINNYLQSRPTISPYLQLLNYGNNGSIGSAGAYQQYVRPAIEARQSAQYQQAEINRLQRQATTTAQSVNNLQQQAQTGIRQTGHETRFMNYSRYYPTLRPGGLQR